MTVWRKSSHSGQVDTADCVELAQLDGTVGIRDSKHPADPHLSVDRETLWALFNRIRSGELDR